MVFFFKTKTLLKFIFYEISDIIRQQRPTYLCYTSSTPISQFR